MSSAHSLDWSSYDELMKNSRLLSPRQMRVLDDAVALAERFPQRFNRGEHRWFSNTCILTMSDYERADRVVKCGTIRRYCNMRRTCPCCSWKYVRKMFKKFHGLPMKDIWFITVSPTEPLLCAEHLYDDPRDVWKAVHDAVMSFVKAGRIRGAMTVEEWAPVDFLYETGLPHVHGLLHCRQVPEWEALRDDINARLLRFGRVKVDTKTTRVLGPAHLFNRLSYLVKPVKWWHAYDKGWQKAEDKELFNTGVTNLINAWDMFSGHHSGITQLGTLNSNHHSFAGVDCEHRDSWENLKATHEWLDLALSEGIDEFDVPLEDQ